MYRLPQDRTEQGLGAGRQLREVARDEGGGLPGPKL